MDAIIIIIIITIIIIYQFFSVTRVAGSQSLFTIVSGLLRRHMLNSSASITLSASSSYYASGCPRPPGDHVIIHLGQLSSSVGTTCP